MSKPVIPRQGYPLPRLPMRKYDQWKGKCKECGGVTVRVNWLNGGDHCYSCLRCNALVGAPTVWGMCVNYWSRGETRPVSKDSEGNVDCLACTIYQKAQLRMPGLEGVADNLPITEEQSAPWKCPYYKGRVTPEELYNKGWFNKIGYRLLDVG